LIMYISTILLMNMKESHYQNVYPNESGAVIAD